MIVQPGYWDQFFVWRQRGKLHVTDDVAKLTTCGKKVKPEWRVEDCFTYVEDIRRKPHCKRCFE